MISAVKTEYTTKRSRPAPLLFFTDLIEIIMASGLEKKEKQ